MVPKKKGTLPLAGYLFVFTGHQTAYRSAADRAPYMRS